ncbi:MAG TPA: HNH endonuclease family protein [Mycobacteriales bacterium]|jgi:hypothetical protein|nr:HNH endonuclease family protein [Mycobacteriales bacterium]
MSKIRALLALLAAVLGMAVLMAPSAQAATVSTTLRAGASGLPVATEVRTGYTRAMFHLWIDADGDGCDTRNEVLIAEATTQPAIGAGCKLTGGRWHSYYDNVDWTLSSDLDIDHLVPLAEAWDSGARNWTATQRETYANDLGDARDLVAVTDNVNQSKGDRDPAEWMPSATSATCRYVAEWVAVKIRWRLTVDSAEKSALTGFAAGCTNVTITVTQAI